MPTDRCATLDADEVASNPDAELIRVEAHLEEIDREYVAITDACADRGLNFEPPEVQARISYLVSEGHKLAEQVAAMPAHTMDGLRAKARALNLYSYLTIEGGPDWSDHDQFLGWSIAQDLLSGRVSA